MSKKQMGVFKEFKKEYIEKNLVSARKSAIFACAFYIAFAGLDAYISGSIVSKLVIVRLEFTLLMAVFLLLSYVRGLKKYWQILFSIDIAVAGIGIVILTTYISCPLKTIYAQGLLLVIFYGYTMNRLLLVPATITGLSISTFYSVNIINCEEISQEIMITSLFFQAAANMFGIYSIYQRQNLLLREFKHKAKVKEQSSKVVTLNSKLIKLNKKLNDLASKDGLTGIANRRYFDQTLDQMILNCQSEENPLSLIMFDIDFFKQYNDFYGHLKGDQCLKRIAKLMEKNLEKSNGVTARFGGEEFCMLFPFTNSQEALKIATQYKKELTELRIQHQSSKISPFVTASFGVVTISNNYSSASAKKIISFADSCLYKSKNKGRNQITTVVI